MVNNGEKVCCGISGFYLLLTRESGIFGQDFLIDHSHISNQCDFALVGQPMCRATINC